MSIRGAAKRGRQWGGSDVSPLMNSHSKSSVKRAGNLTCKKQSYYFSIHVRHHNFVIIIFFHPRATWFIHIHHDSHNDVVVYINSLFVLVPIHSYLFGRRVEGQLFELYLGVHPSATISTKVWEFLECETLVQKGVASRIWYNYFSNVMPFTRVSDTWMGHDTHESIMSHMKSHHCGTHKRTQHKIHTRDCQTHTRHTTLSLTHSHVTKEIAPTRNVTVLRVSHATVFLFRNKSWLLCNVLQGNHFLNRKL